MPRGSVTDVYGAAATGKTQFAFQNALFSALGDDGIEDSRPLVVFVDCAGSFRPERIAEMAEARGFRVSRVLDRITSIYVRSVIQQQESSDRILSSSMFDRCKLVLVDDVTTNFMAEYSSNGKSIETRDDNVYIRRHYELAIYARKLAYLAYSKNIAVLLTNSVRSRLSEDNRDSDISSSERETTGDIISQYGLFRLHFTKRGNFRMARVIQPYFGKRSISFEIASGGILP